MLSTQQNDYECVILDAQINLLLYYLGWRYKQNENSWNCLFCLYKQALLH